MADSPCRSPDRSPSVCFTASPEPSCSQSNFRPDASVNRRPVAARPTKGDTRIYLREATWERIAAHLPWRLTNTSIQTHFALVALPSTTLFSISVPWTTTTLPRTLTSMGPTSIVSALSLPALTAARRPCFVALLPSLLIPVQSSATIWATLSKSPAASALAQSRSSCWISCETPESFAVWPLDDCVSALASPMPAPINNTVATSLFIFLISAGTTTRARCCNCYILPLPSRSQFLHQAVGVVDVLQRLGNSGHVYRHCPVDTGVKAVVASQRLDVAIENETDGLAIAPDNGRARITANDVVGRREIHVCTRIDRLFRLDPAVRQFEGVPPRGMGVGTCKIRHWCYGMTAFLVSRHGSIRQAQCKGRIRIGISALQREPCLGDQRRILRDHRFDIVFVVASNCARERIKNPGEIHHRIGIGIDGLGTASQQFRAQLRVRQLRSINERSCSVLRTAHTHELTNVAIARAEIFAHLRQPPGKDGLFKLYMDRRRCGDLQFERRKIGI